jgi:hypothetical protein
MKTLLAGQESVNPDLFNRLVTALKPLMVSSGDDDDVD